MRRRAPMRTQRATTTIASRSPNVPSLAGCCHGGEAGSERASAEEHRESAFAPAAWHQKQPNGKRAHHAENPCFDDAVYFEQRWCHCMQENTVAKHVRYSCTCAKSQPQPSAPEG